MNIPGMAVICVARQHVHSLRDGSTVPCLWDNQITFQNSVYPQHVQCKNWGGVGGGGGGGGLGRSPGLCFVSFSLDNVSCSEHTLNTSNNVSHISFFSLRLPHQALLIFSSSTLISLSFDKSSVSFIIVITSIKRGAVAQSVERRTPGEEAPRFDTRCGHPIPTGWVGVSIM